MMTSISRALGRSLVLLTLLSACATSSAARDGQKVASAPDFALPTLEGKTAHLSDYLDGKKVVLLDFWSTTCDPCMAEMPHLIKLYESKKDAGLVVLAIALDGPESRGQVAAVAHDRGMSFPVLLDEETAVVAKYNPRRDMPFSVLIGKNGAVLSKHAGYSPGDELLLAEEIEKALRE